MWGSPGGPGGPVCVGVLIAVTAVSVAIGQVSTGVIVAALILLNVVLGSRQELKARASVDALSDLQVPQAKVVRGGGLVLVPAVEVVPGDLVQVEAGDIEARAAVATALHAGIDVRMITGDHAVTAAAIGETLGLGPGAVSGAERQAMSDEELERRLPQLHVFGRVSPQDKLRLARVMQHQGLIVAMTGDAVNDAAALKQADIGVAMGSGSEVTKQAARMILTDDNFGTLVHAVELGRRVYSKIVSYVRYQMTQLLSLVMLFLAATAFTSIRVSR